MGIRLSSKRLFYFLLFLNLLVSSAVFFSFINFKGKGDWVSYLGLAQSILHGKYSYWDAVLPGYIPDTLRPPGYSMFLSLFAWLPSAYKVIQCVQFLIYLGSAWMCTSLLSKLDSSGTARNLFLVLLLPNIQLPFYATQLLPECTVGAALIAFIFFYYRTSKDNFSYVISGLLWLYIFECRPVFLFFPLLFMLWEWRKSKSGYQMRRWALSLIVFILGTLPYGFWNLQHQGTFRITPLEGGGSIIMAGYWQYKLPDVTVPVAAGFTFDDEIICKHDRAQIQKDSATFVSDYHAILDKVKPLMSETDKLYQDTMERLGNNMALWPTYSGKYTIAREKLFQHKAKEYIMNDLGYWCLTRPFNILRLFVTNISWEDWNSGGWLSKVKAIYPTIATGFLMIAFLICFFYNLNKKTMLSMIYFVCFYYWFIYFPFGAQSRYSIPIHLLAIITVSYTIGSFLNQKHNLLRNN